MANKRAVAFVDGFNLYHAINSSFRVDQFKWINLWTLCEQYIRPPYQLADVLYFSALAHWLPEPKKRHLQFIKAQEHYGVRFIEGRFKNKERRCKRCKKSYWAHEEKETDVNIAIHLVNSAHHDEYDMALLVSGDTDLIPAVRMVKENYPAKLFRVLVPGGKGASAALIQAANLQYALYLEQRHLRSALMPKQIISGGGSVVATRPPEYDPPSA
jgi:uncharacterized LabA/DUF88 family protein